MENGETSVRFPNSSANLPRIHESLSVNCMPVSVNCMPGSNESGFVSASSDDDETVGGLRRESGPKYGSQRRVTVQPVSFASKVCTIFIHSTHHLDSFHQASDQSIFARSLASLATKTARQNFSVQERETLKKFSSLNYSPTHSLSYMRWLKTYATG